MAKSIVGLFDNTADARDAVQELVNLGIARSDVSVVVNNAQGEHATAHDDSSNVGEGATAGALGGGVLGGVLGLLVGLGALTIPGIGPVIAAGPLMAALGSVGATTAVGAGIGAASGGLLGALVGAGVPEEEANFYAEGVRRGSTLVAATVEDSYSERVTEIMRRYNVVDIDSRRAEWRQSGWDRFDPNASSAENTWDASSKLGTATGTAAGAATGAAIGSVGGPVGTVIGGLAGAATGAATGAAGDVIGEKADGDNDEHNNRLRGSGH